jgi:hypothetical protein
MKEGPSGGTQRGGGWSDPPESVRIPSSSGSIRFFPHVSRVQRSSFVAPTDCEEEDAVVATEKVHPPISDPLVLSKRAAGCDRPPKSLPGFVC